MTLAAAALPAAADAPRHSPGRTLAEGIASGHQLARRAALPAVTAEIAIIIDDLGHQRDAGLRAIRLPGPVAVAFLPQTPHGAAQAALANAHGKEVLLHLPLEPSASSARAHPAAIRAGDGRAQLRAAFEAALASVPHVRGVNNHQGSLLTRMPEPMAWLMEAMRAQPGLYFVDSRTSGGSVAYRAARAHGVPAAERNVFLDDVQSEGAIREQLHGLIARARRDERALAIGHPYPETLKVLEEELPRLPAYGVRLVAPSELIARQDGRPGLRNLKLSPTLTLAPAAGGPVSPATPATTPAPPALPAARSAAAR